MMKPHIEKEYKMMIDELTYQRILNSFSFVSFWQTNYYYQVNQKDIAMRIRQLDDKYIFTLKKKIENAHQEYEFEIEDNSLNDERIKELLNQFDITNPTYLGYMKTLRSTLDLKFGQFVVDKSEYLGIIDYEIEYELYDADVEDKNEFNDLLDKLNLKFNHNEKSKYARFLLRREK